MVVVVQRFTMIDLAILVIKLFFIEILNPTFGTQLDYFMSNLHQ